MNFIFCLYIIYLVTIKKGEKIMGKNNKRNCDKTFIKVADSYVCVNDLVKAVNASDRKYGIKLKHPNIWAEPEQYLNVVEAKCDMNIAAIICCLNGISVNDYFETDHESGYGTICRPVGIRHSCFTDESILNWRDDISKYDSNSLIFRCRFVSLVLSQLMGRFDSITIREAYYRYKYKHSRSERRIMISKDVMNYLVKFTLLMIKEDAKYQNIILKLHEYTSYTKKNVDYSELRNTLNMHVLNVRRGMQSDLLTDRFMSDDLAIYNILKVAYMLATNKTNLDVLPNFKHIEGATVKHNLIMLIEELGSQIIKNTKDKKYPPMFKAFIEARPLIWSQFYRESQSNYAIQIGLVALAYAKFVFDDMIIDDFIDEMMKKGK